MANRQHFPFPLGELLHLLKAKGFDVSIESILQLQSVLLSSSAIHTKPCELKYILAPLFAKNPEDQAELYKLVDDYIEAKTKEKYSPQKRLWHFFRNRKAMFWLRLSALVVVIFLAVSFYFIQTSVHPDRTSATPQHDSTQIISKPVSQPQVEAPAGPTSIVDTAAPKADVSMNIRVSFSQPVTPERKNISLQISLFLGVLLGAVLFNLLFNENRKLMEKKEAKNRAQTKEIDKEHLTSVEYGLQAEPKSFKMDPVSLAFPSRNYLIEHSHEFLRIRSALKKPLIVEGQSLNIRKSIYATTRRAGFVDIQFDEQIKRRKIVALIEGNPESHVTKLYDYFVHFLQAEKLPVRKFYYEQDVAELKDEAGRIHYLHNVANEFNDHHLIVFGNGECFFAGEFELKRNLASLFRNWDHKYVVTPTPLNDWKAFEDVLAKHGFQIFPAEIEAIELMAAAMVDQAIVPKKKIFNKIKQNYSVADFDLNTAAGIRNYLNDEHLFQIVCALSVYPRLDWNLTLALLAAFGESAEEQPLLHYNTILNLARIPALQETEMRPFLRMELLNSIKPATEVKAREVIIKILKDIEPHIPPSSIAYTELDVQLNVNAFFLFAHDEWEYNRYSYTRDAIADYWDRLEDWTLKERTEQRMSGIMPLNQAGKPQTVSEYMIKEKEIEVQQLRLSKAYVLLLPALLLYILFFIFKPDFVYGAVKKISVKAIVQKDRTCPEGFDFLESHGDKIISVPLQSSATSQTVEIPDVDPERPLVIKLIGKNGFEEIVIPAKYGTVNIKAQCK